MVGQDGVVVDDPLGQFSVKGVDVCKEKILVVINELLLHGAIETFVMRVHFAEGNRLKSPAEAGQ